MIRNYKPDDLPVIMDIGNRAWHNIYRAFREEIYGEELFHDLVSDPVTVKGEQIRKFALAYPDQVLICEEAGKTAGFITFSFGSENSTGVIGNNAVDPDCTLKGIGQQMYQAVLEEFRKRGLKYARVTTGLDESHARARRAYERAGFNIKREDVTYYQKL